MKYPKWLRFGKALLLVVVFTTCSRLTESEQDTPVMGNPIDPLVTIPLPPPRNSEDQHQETQYCFSDGNGNFSNEVVIETGEAENFVWAQGGACIFRPLRTVWAATHNQPLMVWYGVDSSSYTLRTDPPEGITHFYEVNYVVNDIINVKWTMHWYHSVREGTTTDPLQVLVNYAKIRGTRFISYWQGSILLHQVSPDITAITMRDEIRASRTSANDSADAIRDIIQKLRSGDPDWGPLPDFRSKKARR